MSDETKPNGNEDPSKGVASAEVPVEAVPVAADLQEFVDNYRSHPDQTNAYRFAGLDSFMALRPELNQEKLSDEIVLGVLDGDEADIDRLSLQLLEKLIARARREAVGETHLQARGQAITDSLANYLASIMLEATLRHDLALRAPLLVLIRHQLCGFNPRSFEDSEIYQRRAQAISAVCQEVLAGRTPSYTWVAEILGVPTSTITRWFPNGVLIAQGQMMAKAMIKLAFPSSALQALRQKTRAQ